MKINKKLKYLTPEEFYNWEKENCDHTECNACPFKSANCNLYDEDSWVNNKNLFSNEFLNQELEIKAPDILDKQEKEYLRNVIKPFRNRVKYITKETEINAYEFLTMDVINPLNASFYFGTEYISLPYFKSGTMYNNMKVGKKYTLEELGL